MLHDASVPTPLSGARFGLAAGAQPTGVSWSLRTGPGSTQGRRTFRPYAGDVPVELLAGTGGVELPPWAQRRVGGLAMRLWRLLVDLRGYAPLWMTARHERLAERLSCSVRGVETATKRLAAAGMLERKLTRVQREGAWSSNCRLLVLGYYETLRGYEVLTVPSTTLTWCHSQPSHGGWRAGAGRPQPVDKTIKCVGVDVSEAESGDQHQALTTPSVWVIYPSYSSPLFSPSLRNPLPKGKGQPAIAGRPLPVGSLGMIDQRSVPRTSLSQHKLTGDPDAADPKVARHTRHLWLRQLVQAYNEAHQIKFGNRGFVRLPTDSAPVGFSSYDTSTGTTKAAVVPKQVDADDDKLETWKKYPKLLAAARALAEHEIPPVVWATWVMASWSAARGIEHAFVASQVNHNARRAIFRKESGYAYGDGSKHAQPTQQHLEQLYRQRETYRLRRTPGLDPVKASLGFPSWYHDLRVAEVSEGVVDPMDRFPVIRKAGGK